MKTTENYKHCLKIKEVKEKKLLCKKAQPNIFIFLPLACKIRLDPTKLHKATRLIKHLQSAIYISDKGHQCQIANGKTEAPLNDTKP